MPLVSNLQQFVDQLALTCETDLTQAGARLCVALPYSPDYLVLHRLDKWHLYIARVVEEGETYFIPDPSVLVFTHPDQWVPIEILYSVAEWQKFLSTQPLRISARWENGQDVDLVNFTEAWAQCLLDEGWLVYGEKVDRPLSQKVS